MKTRTLYIIAGLMLVTLFAIIGLQGYWLNNAIALARKEYSVAVNKALNETVEELKAQDVLFIVDQSFNRELGDTSIFMFEENYWSSEDTVIHDEFFFVDTTNADLVILSDELENLTEELEVHHEVMNNEANYSVRRVHVPDKDHNHFMDSTEIIIRLENMIHEIVAEYRFEGDPLSRRLDGVDLDSILEVKLANEGVKEDYTYAVHSTELDTLISEYSQPQFQRESGLVFTKSLFQDDVFDQGSQLLLNVPETGQFVLAKMRTVLILALCLTLLMLFTFAFALKTMFRQKRISEMKNDFINNMTHEFKTPVATIRLAVDSAEHPSVLEDQDKLRSYLGIVRSENERIDKQIERVLQIAQLDSNGLQMELAPVNLNDVVNKAVSLMELQLREASIQPEIEAHSGSSVQGSPVHLLQVLTNLIDNAIKYASEGKMLSIKTEVVAEKVVLTVRDQGPGMSKESRKRIFENFYREEGGNVHQTKGFGLGMSYVKRIMELHSGEVEVWSEPGKGTEVKLTFPKL